MLSVTSIQFPVPAGGSIVMSNLSMFASPMFLSRPPGVSSYPSYAEVSLTCSPSRSSTTSAREMSDHSPSPAVFTARIWNGYVASGHAYGVFTFVLLALPPPGAVVHSPYDPYSNPPRRYS